MADLPFIDEHSRATSASPIAAWDGARAAVVEAFDTRSSRLIGRLLGTDPLGPSGARPLAAGSAVTGFAITDAVEGERLTLDGRHRFSTYRLEFLVEATPDGAIIRAHTFAAFAGPHGRIYRALVIGTGGHVLVVRRMLGFAARKAERQERATNKPLA